MRRIRGHHLYCMTLFSGHGYDEAFSGNMAETIRDLKAGEEFLLCEGQDDICAACPNREEGGGCRLGTEDVSERDHAVFRSLHMKAGTVLTWEVSVRKLRCAGTSGFDAVCRNCRWKEEKICTSALLQERLC